ncbi:uncharacterized protein LOC128092399 [Culex pipiens pallens]|uniref:uncharacterized protein LOC128092399 n=1 Tax=Culex pipiens pallens TaxID=42434 RepID=UPI0022AAF770|nr:uncharacterized protein LOC128092399 [Culex pipiens pallens]
MGLDKLKARQHSLIVKVWDTEQIPVHWKQGIICSVNKKGNQLEYHNQSPVSASKELCKAAPYRFLGGEIDDDQSSKKCREYLHTSSSISKLRTTPLIPLY